MAYRLGKLMFAPSPFDSSIGSQPGRSTSYSPVDGPPPHAAPRPAGADTTSLLGPQQDNSSGAMTPKARVLAACAMLQQASNIIATDAPGALQLFPQLVPMVQELSASLPQMMDELSRMTNPLAMFASIGSALSGPGGSQGQGPGMGSSPSPVLTNPNSAAGVPSRMPM